MLRPIAVIAAMLITIAAAAFRRPQAPLAGRRRSAVAAAPALGVAAACILAGAATLGSAAAMGAVDRAAGVTATGPVSARVAAPDLAAVGEAEFFGTSCTAVRQCVAVGTKFTSTATSTGTVTLAEQWGGGRWRVLPTPSPAGMPDSWLNAVSCVSQASCVAVGTGSSPSALIAVAEQWNGRRWRLIPPSTPPGTQSSLLSAVWCRARWGCLAVGADGILPLAERWTGSRWLMLPGLTPSFAPDGVSCAGSSCMAVGSVNQSRTGNVVPFAERWNGRRWQELPMPAPRQATAVMGAAVSCPSAAQCLAVGYSGVFHSVPFADRWTRGGWRLLRLPARMPAATQLLGLSCPAVTECVAVGGRSPGTVRAAPVALAWNGLAWRLLRVPGPLSTNNQFAGVSCPSPGGCLAAGLVRTGPSQAARPIAEWWNGHAWQAVRLPA